MSKLKLIKISSTGEQLADDASAWDAVLLPDHGLMFTATHVAADVPHDDCVAACTAATVAGFSDWTLPDIDQLSLVIDRTRRDPAINVDYFRDIASDWYWSTTPVAGSAASAWYVGFNYGLVYYYHRGLSGFALAVRRAGQ